MCVGGYLILHNAFSRLMKLKPFHPYMVKIGVLLMKMKKSIALRLMIVWINQNGPSVCRYSGVKEFGTGFAVGLMPGKILCMHEALLNRTHYLLRLKSF